MNRMKTGLVLEGGYRKKPEAVLLTKLKYRKYPKFAKTLLNRAEDYNLCMDEILEMEKLGEKQMKQILLSEHGALKRRQSGYEAMGLQLRCETELIDLIAQTAAAENLGARSVENVLDALVADHDYDAIAGGFDTLVLHAGMIESGEPPRYEWRRTQGKKVVIH